MRWMNLEPIVQSEVGQKKKNKYCMLLHVYGIWKDGTDEPICRAAVEMQTERTDCGHSVGGRGWDELREQRGNIYIAIYKTDSQWEFAVWHQELSPELWTT